MDDVATDIGVAEHYLSEEQAQLRRHANLQLASLEQPVFLGNEATDYLGIAGDLLRNYQQQKKLLAGYRCPVDRRIQDFLNTYFSENQLESTVTLPGSTFVLDRPHLARELSLPPGANQFSSPYVNSYRLLQGVLHNPVNDRRTTKGVFHITEGGLPVPKDKKAVPVNVFHALFQQAMQPPEEALSLPFTSAQDEQAKLWVSLLLRPLVSPAIPDINLEKSMEIRVFAPGSLVSNLDFLERIFGNAGDPFLPENDAALDISAWSGHTGCIILAPHLVKCRARDIGLPHFDQAAERQRSDGMYWKDEDDLYNGGAPFKIVCRDMRGVIVTIIADNYFGYSKKEVKSQISYAANLYGGCEEEHSGGAVAFPCYNLGEVFQPDTRIKRGSHNFAEMVKTYGAFMEVREPGYAIDKRYPDIIYVPENTRFDLLGEYVSWESGGICHRIKLLARHTYIYPFGYKVRMEKHPKSPAWRLIGTEAEGTFCHKPCTVSGGGKSEISKSILGTLISGPLYIGDIKEDLDFVESIFTRDYSDRFNDPQQKDARSFLNEDRSLGSSIKLLTPSETEYTSEYNDWLESIPQHIRALAYIIKRFYRQDWGNRWREHFSVNVVNSYPGHELKFGDRLLVATYLRVGVEPSGSWRIYKLRQDYVGADKVQMEDDITVSATVAASCLGYQHCEYDNPSFKLVLNCEQRLFQRPDDAIHRGLDLQAEADLAEEDNFISNFEPLDAGSARELIEDAIGFYKYTDHMQQLIQRAAIADDGRLFVSSAHPRLVNGKPTPNVRYLQQRPDLVNAREVYIAEMGVRLYQNIPQTHPIYFPVNAVLPGRRNNAGDPAKHIRSLAVYNPLHYQELPELFMDYISSLTGKSPSTTGAGSEGALTKGPFNALMATADLNNALVSTILCNYDGFSSAAGYIGPDYKMEHDISLLIPEIWCRIPVSQRNAHYMIERGYLEKLEDFAHEGKTILASRLGYRITSQFVHAYLGKIFDNPNVVFEDAMLKPELQDMAEYVDGISNIVEAQQRAAQEYLDDGSVENACPPLKALLHIMATGHYQHMDVNHPDFRYMFTREYLLQSDWYHERLSIKQEREIQLWQRHAAYVDGLLQNDGVLDEVERLDLEEKRDVIERHLQYLYSDAYLECLQGTIGADWIDQGRR